jgi:predicted MFS family arabinose efflux permease
MTRQTLRVVLALGTTQTLAWASSYYLPAILADAIGRDLGASSTFVFGAFSASLLIAALLGPRVGRTIDVFGGRGVLALSNIVFALGLVLLAVSYSLTAMSLAWAVLGIGMSLGLYDAGFAALGRIYGAAARPAITGITLMAGFASTIGWPLTAFGLDAFGWRETCLAWALAHVLIGLPINWFLLPANAKLDETQSAKPRRIRFDRNMVLLSIAFALGWMVTGAMAAHFPRLMQSAGASAAEAVAAGALIGPAQVVARVIEATFFARYHPLLSARLATITHPIGAALLTVSAGPFAAALFAILHGSGNGILTIARGTVPLAIFGPANYGYRLGIIGAPSRVAQAAAPLLFGWFIDLWGAGALVVSSAMCLLVLAALLLVRPAGPAGTS